MTKHPNYAINYTTNLPVLPLNLGIKIEKDSVVYTYLELMKGIELKKYFEKPSNKGRIRKNRVRILNVILFGFMVDVRSTRALESACRNDIRFMYLLGEMNPPSHTTINEVMKEVGDRLTSLLLEINQEIMKKETVEMDKLYIDGTKIEADANKYTFVWKKAVQKNREKLYKKITNEAPKLNQILEEYNYKTFVIKDKYKSKEIKKIYLKLQGVIEHLRIKLVYGKGQRKQPIQRVYDNFYSYAKKLEEYEEHLTTIGPKRNSYSKTDNDATFMHMKEDHMRNAQLKPGYNVQIGVSNEYIMVIEAYTNGADQLTFEPLLEKYNIMYDKYPKYPVADAGYGSFDNYTYCINNKMELYQKYGMWEKERSTKFKKDKYRIENMRINKKGEYICPNNKKFEWVKDYKSKYKRYDHTISEYECFYCSKCRQKKKCTKSKNNRTITVLHGYKEMKEKVKENLASPLGIELRTQRSIQVEGAFGVIKEDMKFRRFTRTMFSGIRLELNLIAIGYNLKKFHNKKYR